MWAPFVDDYTITVPKKSDDKKAECKDKDSDKDK